jgi:hypothetical protein
MPPFIGQFDRLCGGYIGSTHIEYAIFHYSHVRIETGRIISRTLIDGITRDSIRLVGL